MANGVINAKEMIGIKVFRPWLGGRFKRKNMIKVTVVVIEMIGSRIIDKEKRRKCIRKKNGEEIPPVELTIPIIIKVKTTDSINLE